MKRLVITAILKMCGKVILLTLLVGIVIGIMGYWSKWNTALAYSNAFFVAGCLLMGAAGLSRLNAGNERNFFLLPHTESFRDLSSSERANFIINASSPASMVFLGVLSGLLLILISLIAAYLL